MKLTKKCQYGLRAVFELAWRYPGGPAKVHDLADSQGLPKRFLEVILNELRLAGLVQSERGNEGGYTLAREPGEITLADVIEVVQGPIGMADAEKVKGVGYIRGGFAFRRFWQSVNQAVAVACHSTTFAELVETERMNTYSNAPDYVI